MTPDTLTVDGTTYIRSYPVAPGRCPSCGAKPKAHWTVPRMIAAAHAHKEAHGAFPNNAAWIAGTPEHPSANYVRAMFGSWATFITACGGEAGKRRTIYWTTERIIGAMQRWAHAHDGRPPAAKDWVATGVDHPTNKTVQERFGSWNAGLEASGFWARGHWGAVLVGRELVGPRGELSHRRRGMARVALLEAA